jgi:hypothetical protein
MFPKSCFSNSPERGLLVISQSKLVSSWKIANPLTERYRRKNLQASELRAVDRKPENAERPVPQTPDILW